MKNQIKHNPFWISVSSLCCLIASLAMIACETTAPPESSSGDEAGESQGGSGEGGSAAGTQVAGEMTVGAGAMMAGESSGGSEAGDNAGDEAGDEAGNSSGTGVIIEAGDTAGEMSSTPNFDPTEPLPTPQATSVAPPTKISEPSDDPLDATCGAQYVSEVRGWVVDEIGEPMSGAKVQLCVRVYGTGELLCVQPKDTQAEGYFSVAVPESARCMSDAALRALVPRVAFAPMYCHADFSVERTDGVLRLTEPLVLYQTRPALSAEDLGDPSQPHSVELIGDLSLTLIPDDLYGPEISGMGGRALSPDAPGLCFIHGDSDQDGDPQIDGVYAFAPEGDLTGSTATARFPNTAEYEPGAEVNLYVLGNLDCSIEGQMESLEEASWSIQGRAQVDDSGMWIETIADAGLPCFSWFGYGLAP
jgi:hypothetical protein